MHACVTCRLQVVAFQQMMQIMAEQFPGAFSGYKLDVVESHQRNKADTSGTAKAVVQSFAQMGVDFKEVRTRHSGSTVGVCQQQLVHGHLCCWWGDISLGASPEGQLLQ